MTATQDRFTIDKVDFNDPPETWKPRLADYGRRRHLSYTLDFDTRVHSLEPAGEGWTEEAKAMHLENQERVRRGLANEFGPDQLDAKIQNFIDIGSKPFSVLAYHNRFSARFAGPSLLGRIILPWSESVRLASASSTT